MFSEVLNLAHKCFLVHLKENVEQTVPASCFVTYSEMEPTGGLSSWRYRLKSLLWQHFSSGTKISFPGIQTVPKPEMKCNSK